MSLTSDKKVNGKEVTPFLNSLKRDSHVYYNGKMHENVTIGESSDELANMVEGFLLAQGHYEVGIIPVVVVGQQPLVGMYGGFVAYQRFVFFFVNRMTASVRHSDAGTASHMPCGEMSMGIRTKDGIRKNRPRSSI